MNQEPNVSKINLASKEKLQLTIGNDIVDYIESSRAFGLESMSDSDRIGKYQRRVISLPNRKGNISTPMVLSIGNHNQLSLVCYNGPADGWIQYTLSDNEQFKKYGGDTPEVTAVDAFHSDEEGITIAVAVKEENSPLRSRIFVCNNINSSKADWDEINWKNYGTRSDADVTIDALRIMNKNGEKTIILSGNSKKEGPVMYLMNASATRPTFNKAIAFEASLQLNDIRKFEAGVAPVGGAGLFVLGAEKNKTKLSYRPFPEFDPDDDESTIDVTTGNLVACPEQAHVIDIGRVQEDEDGDYGTNIYFGGDGIHMLPYDQVSKHLRGKLVTIAAPGKLPKINDLIVTEEADGDTTIWALTAADELYMFYKKAGDKNWNEVLVEKEIAEIAVAEGDKHLTASLIIVNKQNQSLFLMRDEITGSWTETPLTLKDEEKSRKITCFSTTARLLDADGLPVQFRDLTISASILSQLIINGRSVFVGPGKSFTTSTDLNGAVTIYDKAHNYLPAFYRIAVDGVNEVIDVNPASTLMEKMQGVTDTDLKKATVPNESGHTVSMLPKELTKPNAAASLSSIAEALRQVSAYGNNTNTGIPGIWKAKASAPFSSFLAADVESNISSDGYLWAVRSGNEGLQALIPGSFALSYKTVLPDNNISDFFRNASDLLAEGWTIALKQVKEGAKKAFHLICEIGGKIKAFVIKRLEQIGSFFESMFNEIKVGFEKVVSWAKMVFDWQDIIRVRDAFVQFFDQGLVGLGKKVVKLREPIISVIDDMIEKVQDLKGPEYEKAKLAGIEQDKKEDPANKLKNDPDKESASDKMMGNSIFATIQKEFQKVMDNIVTIEGKNPLETLITALKKFAAKTATKSFDAIMLIYDAIKKDLGVIIEGRLQKLSDISFSTIFEIIKVVGLNSITGVLATAKILIYELFELLGQIIQAVRELGLLRIRFPFIEKIYKFFTDEDADISFRIIDAVMLMVAIPATVMYKMFFKSSPVKEGHTLAPAYGKLSLQNSSWISVKNMKALATLAMPAYGIYTAITDTFYSIKEMAGGATSVVTKKPDPFYEPVTLFEKAKDGFTKGKDFLKGKYDSLSSIIVPILGFGGLIFEISTTLMDDKVSTNLGDYLCWTLGGMAVFCRWTYCFNEGTPSGEALKGIEGFFFGVSAIIRGINFVFFTKNTGKKATLKFTRTFFSEVSKVTSAISFLKLAKNPKAKLALCGVTLVISIAVFIPASIEAFSE
ncbi:hypothetical protein [Sediminibacterium ginsengisoli]|uniref:Uncharacterized protein n=1 Tax=Sediminibacterium ginsengisoli TaxID=413434 RepID=A0A1T4JU02_9BACT|nr:hypothetical protein [Sediminibacterium ginsengisoli]SJZ33638.1 hypothetical protein SAMN04488132_101187 [Sediminibacterium ginsengisoli]